MNDILSPEKVLLQFDFNPASHLYDKIVSAMLFYHAQFTAQKEEPKDAESYRGKLAYEREKSEEPKEGEKVSELLHSMLDRRVVTPVETNYWKDLNKSWQEQANEITYLKSQIATLNKRISEFGKKGTGRIEWGTNRE